MTEHNNTHSDVYFAIKNAKMCEGLTELQIHSLSAIFTPVKIQQGEDVIKHDERGQDIFIIISGLIEVEIPLVGTQEASAIAKLGPGDSVGEFALLREARRSAGARAITNAQLIRASSSEILKVFATEPAMGYCVCRNLGRILVDRLSDTNMQLRGALSR